MSTRAARVSLWLLSLALVSGAAAAPPLADREVLPNGIVLLVSERHALPIVAMTAYVRAGAVLDPPASLGLANLTAELLTRAHDKVKAMRTWAFVSQKGGVGKSSLATLLGRYRREVRRDVLHPRCRPAGQCSAVGGETRHQRADGARGKL